MNKEHILIIEDDVDVNHLVSTMLRKKSYSITQAFSGSEGMLQLNISDFDLIILDLMLPGLTGEEIIIAIQNKEIPVLVLSAKSSLKDRVSVLDLGADDYMTKPFETEELLARVNSILRRSRKNPPLINVKNNLVCRALSLNLDSREVYLNDKKLNLTKNEFDILYILLKHPNKVFSREALFEQVWHTKHCVEDNTINVHVSNIRKKIKSYDSDEYIKTVWGIGFKLSDN